MEEESAFPPSSPGVSQVQLVDCLEELLKFTLSSSVEETLEIDLGLSKDYCSGLLKVDLDDLGEFIIKVFSPSFLIIDVLITMNSSKSLPESVLVDFNFVFI